MRIFMVNVLGSVNGYQILECIGIDAARGIIGREHLLSKSIFLFRDCPMIHSFFVRFPFIVTFLDKNGILLGEQTIVSNHFSGYYQHSSICLESKEKLLPETIQAIYDIAAIDQ